MQLRFVERRLPLTKEEIAKKVDGASYIINVDIHLDPAFSGFVTVVCDGPMVKAVASDFRSMSAFKGWSYTFDVAPATKRRHPARPVTVTIYATSEIHVREVNLRE